MQHAVEYERLFTACDVVVSAPLSTGLAGARTLHRREINALAHLPRRLYLGIARRAARRAPATVREYDTRSGTFVDAPPIAVARVTELLRDLGLLTSTTCAHLLIEAQDGRGMSIPGTLSATAAFLAAVVRGELDASTVRAWQRTDPHQLIRDPAFSALVRTARPLQRHVRPGKQRGASVVTALLASPATLVASAPELPVLSTPRDFGARSDDPTTWGLDVALLATGARHELGVEPAPAVDQGAMTTFLEQLQQLFPTSAPLRLPLSPVFPEAVQALGDYLFLDTLRSWTSLWGERGKGGSVDGLLAAVRRRMALVMAGEVLHPLVVATIRAADAELGAAGSAVFPANVGTNGGSLLILARAGAHRDALLRLPDVLRTLGAAGATLDYASWRDGTDVVGVRVEQDVARDALHHALPPRVTRWRAFAGVTTDVGLSDADEPPVDRADVVLDVRGDALYVAGERVPSQEVPLQGTVIALLRRLLETPERAVTARRLPTAVRSVAWGAVPATLLAPLVRSVRARTGKELGLTAHGTTTGRSITLSLGEVTVGVIEPLDRG